MSHDIYVCLFRTVLTVAAIQQTLRLACTASVAQKFRLYFTTFSLASAVVIYIDFLLPTNTSHISLLAFNLLLFLYGAAASTLATRKIQPSFDEVDAALAMIATGLTSVAVAAIALHNQAPVALAIGSTFVYAVAAPVAVMFATSKLRDYDFGRTA